MHRLKGKYVISNDDDEKAVSGKLRVGKKIQQIIVRDT